MVGPNPDTVLQNWRVNFCGLYLIFTALTAFFSALHRCTTFVILSHPPHKPHTHDRSASGLVNLLLPVAASPHRAYPRTHILLN